MMIGGAEITAKFTLSTFLNLEERTNGPDGAQIILKINPGAVVFQPNQSVTNWSPIKKQFPGLHITEGAVVDFDIKQILTRLRLRANLTESGSNPLLLLEGLILSDGTWEAVPMTNNCFLLHF